MVRPSPSLITARRRGEGHALNRVDSVISELVRRRTPQGVDISLTLTPRAKAAEALSLFVCDDPGLRARFGAATGVLEALVSLVDNAWRAGVAHDLGVDDPQTDEAFEAAEAAAEAIWILAYNSSANHAALLRLGAIEALAATVTARDVHGLNTPARAAMWAAAALQNLAASYCETADGRCPWYFEQGDPRLFEPGATISVDAEGARRRIGGFPGLIDALMAYLCEGPGAFWRGLRLAGVTPQPAPRVRPRTLARGLFIATPPHGVLLSRPLVSLSLSGPE
jgi:hypothetical protein